MIGEGGQLEGRAMRSTADLVVIGAGIVGCSAAYHLARKGWRNLVVVDRGPLFETGGSTSHAPGLAFQTNASRMMTEFARYSLGLFKELTVDGEPCLDQVGGIEVASTKERWHDLKRKQGWAKSYSIESALLTPAEVREKIPLIDETKIHGGYYVPSDGDVRSVDSAAAMARAAEAAGAAEFHGHTTVTDVEVRSGEVKGVVTDRGRIETGQVLLCTNMWAPVLARRLGLPIPLMGVQHLYAITSPISILRGERRAIVHPILRDQDHSMYYRQHGASYGIGSYQHEPILVDPAEVPLPAKRPFTQAHFARSWDTAVQLLPPVRETEIQASFNGIFAFTIDGMPILGEAPHVRGLWVAVGAWVTHSGGVGRAIAEWMTDGVTAIDLREADISRFHRHSSARSYILVRCAQQYREVYAIKHPKDQIMEPRGVRVSPFHPRLCERGAVFFEGAGWERPQWFEENEKLLERYDLPRRVGWEARLWSPIDGAEHLATREGVAMFDLSPFAKFEVSGPGALKFLNHLAANQIDRPVGRVIYTPLLNSRGGIRSDLTVTRLAEDRFWVVTGGGTGPLDLRWILDHAPPDATVRVTDVSPEYCAIGLWGPKARDVLSAVCAEDASNEAFPYLTARSLSIGPLPALALRISYVGELGWEIYAPSQYGLVLWDLLWEAGQRHGVIAAGGGAFDSLRLEKGYRLWGADIHTEYKPFEAGLTRTVRLEKEEFLGREALLRLKEAATARRLCCLTLDDPGGAAMGKEPILDGDRALGYVTSANYGYSVGRFIVYGYLPVSYSREGTQVEVEYFGTRQRASVRAEPLFDPANARLRA